MMPFLPGLVLPSCSYVSRMSTYVLPLKARTVARRFAASSMYLSPLSSVCTSGPDPYLAAAPTLRFVCGDSDRSFLIGFFSFSSLPFFSEVALLLPLVASVLTFFFRGLSSDDESEESDSEALCLLLEAACLMGFYRRERQAGQRERCP